MDRRLINKNDPDRAWYQIPGLTDKGNHKVYGAAVCALLWLITWNAFYGVIAAAVAGLVWEYGMYLLKNRKFDWWDIEATVLGGIYFGAAVTGIIKIVNYFL